MIAYDLNKDVFLNSKIINNQTNRFYSINSSSYFEVQTLEGEISILELVAKVDNGDFIEIHWINKSDEIYTKEKSIKMKVLSGITNRYMFQIPDKNVCKIKIHLTNRVATNIYIESLKSYSSVEDFIESNITREFALNNDIGTNLDKNMLQIMDKVSIITVNHNSSDFIEKLLNSIYEKVKYKNIEIIIIDNASVDNSMSIIKSYCDKLNIKIIENKENETFSKSSNQGAKIATGKYLLFTNNDVEVIDNWIEELLYAQKTIKKVGLTGSLLFYPNCSLSTINYNKSFTIQHCGIKFKNSEDGIWPYNFKNGDDISQALKKTTPICAVTGASFMIEKKKFEQVNGFCEDYIYGYEDVDLSLKLIKKGYCNYLVPSSIAIHKEFGTQSEQSSNVIMERRLNNKKVFKSRWNKWLEKKITEDLLENKKIYSEKNLKIAFAVTDVGENVKAGDYFTALEFSNSMKKQGWEIEFLSRKKYNWYNISEDTDIVISLLDSFDIDKIVCKNKKLIKIAWARNWFDRWVSKPYIKNFDFIFASSEIACEFMENLIGIKVNLLKIATNDERFYNTGNFNEEFECDYCFTGNYWDDYREIIDTVDIDNCYNYKFKIFGENWNKIERFRNVAYGFVNYNQIPNVYKSTKLIIDDANRATKPLGSVNSRVYDALCNGVLVITNGELGAQLTFGDKLPIYKNKDDLKEKIKFYLESDNERTKLVEELQSLVIENHTYNIRVQQFVDTLKKNSISIK